MHTFIISPPKHVHAITEIQHWPRTNTYQNSYRFLGRKNYQEKEWNKRFIPLACLLPSSSLLLRKIPARNWLSEAWIKLKEIEIPSNSKLDYLRNIWRRIQFEEKLGSAVKKEKKNWSNLKSFNFWVGFLSGFSRESENGKERDRERCDSDDSLLRSPFQTIRSTVWKELVGFEVWAMQGSLPQLQTAGKIHTNTWPNSQHLTILKIWA